MILSIIADNHRLNPNTAESQGKLGFLYERGNMEYIKKEDLLKIFEGLLKAREGKNCSRQVIIEKQIYQYVVNIINTITTYEHD